MSDLILEWFGGSAVRRFGGLAVHRVEWLSAWVAEWLNGGRVHIRGPTSQCPFDFQPTHDSTH